MDLLMTLQYRLTQGADVSVPYPQPMADGSEHAQ